MARFQKLRDSAYKSALGSNYLEQGKYAEARGLDGRGAGGGRPEDARGLVRRRRTEALRRRRGPSSSPTSTATRPSTRSWPGRPASACCAERRTASATPPPAAGLGTGAASLAVAGDYDNDGLPDLLVVRPGEPRALPQQGQPRLRGRDRRRRDARVPAPGRERRPRGHRPRRGPRRRSWPGRRRSAPSLLLQNAGNGTFTDVTAAARRGRPRPRGRGRADRLRQPARRRPLRPALRPPGALQEHARRQLRGPGGRPGPRRPGALPERGRGRREQGRLHRLLPRGEGAVVARAERRPGGLRRLAGAGGGLGRPRRPVRRLRQRRPPRPAGGDGEGERACCATSARRGPT